MTQPNLFSAEPVRPKKAGHVRSTSIAAAHELREHLSEREGAVLDWLTEYPFWTITDAVYQPNPTSAELAQRRWSTTGFRGKASTDCVPYVRRGLSDLQTHGLVESAGKRKCQVSGKVCLTWRVRSR